MWIALLLVTWAVALIACGRVCLAAVSAARPRSVPAGPRITALTLYEAAFLAGGPQRVTDLALVAMGRQRRLLLAHTGWATVVDPVGRDELERSVITAIGPDGQSPVPAIRAAHRTADAVRDLSDRLTAAGLAVPARERREVSLAIRRLRWACLVVLCTGAAAVLTMPPEAARGPAPAWFALPLVLTAGCLAMALVEVHPHTNWASHAGRKLLDEVAAGPPPADDRGLLAALAVRGRRALADPGLRAALSARLQGYRY